MRISYRTKVMELQILSLLLSLPWVFFLYRVTALPTTPSPPTKMALPTPPDSRPLSPHEKGSSEQYFERAILTPTFGRPPTPLTPGLVHTPTDSQEKYMVVSPYTSEDHLLDLNSVSLPNQLLAQALTSMDLVREDYATAPYIESFNWQIVVEKLQGLLSAEPSFHWEAQSFYIVVFRSQIPPTTDRSHLGQLDEAAHAEATASGGLLKYWFGVPDATGRNLATCEF